MRRSVFVVFVVAAILAIQTMSVSAAQGAAQDMIVLVGSSPTLAPAGGANTPEAVLSTNAQTRSIVPTHIYSSAVMGFAARLTAAQQAALAADPRVRAMVPDEETHVADAAEPAAPVPVTRDDPSPIPSAAPTPTPTASPLPTPGPDRQIVPTGIERVGRPSLGSAPLAGTNEKADVDIAIVDTGVAEHPDLNVVGGTDCTGSRIGWHDGYGHGTHVAGIAAARDNDFGVVGVAPGARIWSVKVLNSSGYGKASWLLCGIDWITAQRDGANPLIEVANMSLRFHGATRRADDGNCGYTNNDPIHQAICASAAAGTIFVAAAGNDQRNAARYRPAAYDEVITVSALSDFDGHPGSKGALSEVCPAGYSSDRDDVLANFSNYGRDVDIMAPGKCIWSTNNDGGYRVMSGTSMATPHVSGAVAVYRIAHPAWSFFQIRDALIACGTQDWRWRTDRDRWHEPVLNVARLC